MINRLKKIHFRTFVLLLLAALFISADEGYEERLKLKLKGEVWQQGETLSCSIGQSYILASILQMANAYAAIASEGKLYRPYLVQEIFDNSGKLLQKFEPELIRNIKLKPSTFKLVKEGLYRVANTPKGTAWWRRGRGNQMAGKTGTSQVVSQAADKLYKKCEEAEEKFRHHGLFVAFAPFDNPKIAAPRLALMFIGIGIINAPANFPFLCSQQKREKQKYSNQ
jgi:cell division protein FtsI/penicillin-binding protein 2